MEDAVSYLIFSADTLLAIITFLYAVFNSGTVKAVKMEGRISKIEANQITTEERRCVQENDVKMKLIFGMVESEFPKFLRRDTTPSLDILFDKVKVIGVKALTTEEASVFEGELEKEIQLAIKEKDGWRAMALGFYSALVKSSHMDGKEGCKK